jgi:hypothetical protein
VEFLAIFVPEKYPIRVASSKCILSILKCLYQRSPFASWSKVIGFDISGPFGRTQTIRYRFRKDRCPSSALFHSGVLSSQPDSCCNSRTFGLLCIGGDAENRGVGVVLPASQAHCLLAVWLRSLAASVYPSSIKPA